MRRMSAKARDRLIKTNHRRLMLDLRRKGVSKFRALPRGDDVKLHCISAPRVIDILNMDPHHELIGFIREVRRSAATESRIRLDFKATEKINSGGTLLMLAELDRLVRAKGDGLTLTCSYPKNEMVEKVFQQIGLFRLLNKEHRLEITEDDIEVVHWRYASGIDVSPIQADPILKGIKAQIPKTYRKVVVGVEEAMDNAVHHAYLEPRGDRLSGTCPEADARRWWIFAELLDDWLHVVFCDLGIGIPKSLPKQWLEEAEDIATLAVSSARRDVKMINRAFDLGRTRTDLDHRGKGLKNIAKAAEELGGALMIHSNAACVRKDFRSGILESRNICYKRSIMGTVIQWSIPLKNAGMER